MKTLTFILLLIGLQAQAQLMKQAGIGITPAVSPLVVHTELGQRVDNWYFGTQAQWKLNGWPDVAIAPIAGGFCKWNYRFFKDQQLLMYLKYDFIIAQMDEHKAYMEKYNVSNFGFGVRNYMNDFCYIDLSVASRQIVCVMGIKFGKNKTNE